MKNLSSNATFKQKRERELVLNTIMSTEAREAALMRLLAALEADAPEYPHTHTDNALESGGEMSRLARLRAAHAAYALATSGKFNRLSQGAWVRERGAINATSSHSQEFAGSPPGPITPGSIEAEEENAAILRLFHQELRNINEGMIRTNIALSELVAEVKSLRKSQ